jgi:flagellar motor switch protein FliM
MTASQELQTLDFQDPRRLGPTSSRVLQRWQKDACERILESWSAMLVHPVQMRTVSLGPVRYAEGLKSLPDPGLGLVLLVGPEEIPTLLTFSNGLLLRLLEATLGAPGEAWPEPRELTPLEFTMTEVLFQTLTEGLSEGWPGQDPLPLHVSETCRPRRCRLFPTGTELVSVRWEITCGAGKEETVWLMPRESIEELLDVEQTPGGVPAVDPNEELLASIATQLPVEVVVDLGSASLSMSEISELQVGDVVILDQAVARPLVARIGDQPRWSGVPCRVGGRQALDIRGAIGG